MGNHLGLRPFVFYHLFVHWSLIIPSEGIDTQSAPGHFKSHGENPQSGEGVRHQLMDLQPETMPNFAYKILVGKSQHSLKEIVEHNGFVRL